MENSLRSHLNRKNAGCGRDTCLHSADGKPKIGCGLGQPGQKPSSKLTRAKRAGDVVQEI
jgi:hypothetical protein